MIVELDARLDSVCAPHPKVMTSAAIPVPAMNVTHAFFTLVGHDLTQAIDVGRFVAMPTELALSTVAGTTIGALHAITTTDLPLSKLPL